MIYKCKNCGGSINVTAKVSVAQCPYCKFTQTFPLIDNETEAILFNRANDLLRECDFDRAESVYEKLIEEGCEDSEAYWGLVLCKFGIEYVEDSKTGNRIPTCHRVAEESIAADLDFRNAYIKADEKRRSMYVNDAKEIARKQKSILNLVREEKPYDVFISFKQSDKNGKPTNDYIKAQGLYQKLTAEGLRVFFSPVSLMDHPGEDYEPFIFAALNSAKVMLVVGSSHENIDSVWVRNEWKRFFKLHKADSTKLIIACIFGMSPYDLPDEFRITEAVDMENVNFLDPLVAKVKSAVGKSNPVYEAKSVQEAAAFRNNNIDSWLERVYIFLEDGDFAKADQYCERILDINPKSADAYLGKLMAELKVRERKLLKDNKTPFDKSSNCIKAGRFDSALAAELAEDNRIIRERNEMTHKQETYKIAESKSGKPNSEKNFEETYELYSSIKGYEDSEEKAKQCLIKYANYLDDKINDNIRSSAITKDAICNLKKQIDDINDNIKDYKEKEASEKSDLEKVHKTKMLPLKIILFILFPVALSFIVSMLADGNLNGFGGGIILFLILEIIALVPISWIKGKIDDYNESVLEKDIRHISYDIEQSEKNVISLNNDLAEEKKRNSKYNDSIKDLTDKRDEVRSELVNVYNYKFSE